MLCVLTADDYEKLMMTDEFEQWGYRTDPTPAVHSIPSISSQNSKEIMSYTLFDPG